jgi:hypothetical protein
MAELQSSDSASVRATVDQIVQLLEAHGSMSSEQVVSRLGSAGVDEAAVSTAVAYAIQQGSVALDWAFNVSRREVQPA